jgi:hypothetical protein
MSESDRKTQDGVRDKLVEDLRIRTSHRAHRIAAQPEMLIGAAGGWRVFIKGDPIIEEDDSGAPGGTLMVREIAAWLRSDAGSLEPVFFDECGCDLVVARAVGQVVAIVPAGRADALSEGVSEMVDVPLVASDDKPRVPN